MIGMIVCLATLTANPPTVPSAPQTYLEARNRAGKSPEDQFKLALWCESHGLLLERARHLSLAILADPRHPGARGLLGLVDYQDRWLRPDSVADRFQAEPSLADYEARRLLAPDTADGHLALGVWASEHGLKDQARAHLIASTRLDPSRPDAWKRLGYARHGTRWLTDAQVLAEKLEADAQKQADVKWKAILEKYRLMLAVAATRAKAEAGLLEVTDPRAVPSIGRVFANTPTHQPRAVELLGQIQTPASSRSLAYLAAFGQNPKVRRLATETLRRRDPREFADLLIAQLADPIRFEVKHVDGPSSPGEILIEGKKVNLRRVYTPPSVLQAGDRLDYDRLGRAVVVRQVEPSVGTLFPGDQVDSGFSRITGMTRLEVEQALPIIAQSSVLRPIMSTTRFTIYFSDRLMIPVGQLVVEAQKSAVATEQQLRDDVRMIEDHNADVRSGNDRLASVLNDATGQSLPPVRSSWSRWWVDRIGYASSSSSNWTSKASQVQEISIAYQTPLIPQDSEREIYDYARRSCFGAGTTVRTIAGPRAIESLQVGDRVLTQDPSTGRLGYRPVLKVHRNPPSPTFRVTLRGQAIVSSPFHRFWVAGQGWVMARELKAGDPIRTLGEVSPVESIEADAVQAVFNLDVEGDATFFAGDVAALVHDNTLPDPRVVPFDAIKLK